MNRINNKGQEEAVGFIAIIVIVSVALVFFIGLSLRDDGKTTITKSTEISQFLEASYRYTTNCEISLKNRYADMGDLMKACYQNDMASCYDGKNVCSVYNETMQSLLNMSFVTGEQYAIKGYVFNSSYGYGKTAYKILDLQKGTCNGDYKAEEYLTPDAAGKGTYAMQLRLCS